MDGSCPHSHCCDGQYAINALIATAATTTTTTMLGMKMNEDEEG